MVPVTFQSKFLHKVELNGKKSHKAILKSGNFDCLYNVCTKFYYHFNLLG